MGQSRSYVDIGSTGVLTGVVNSGTLRVLRMYMYPSLCCNPSPYPISHPSFDPISLSRPYRPQVHCLGVAPVLGADHLRGHISGVGQDHLRGHLPSKHMPGAEAGAGDGPRGQVKGSAQGVSSRGLVKGSGHLPSSGPGLSCVSRPCLTHMPIHTPMAAYGCLQPYSKPLLTRGCQYACRPVLGLG